MLAKTHLAFGFLFGLLVKQLTNVGNVFVYFAIVLIASLLPDIDSPNSKASRQLGIIGKVTRTLTKHRGIFHSIWVPLVSSILLWHFVGKTYAIALVAGYMSHLIIDGFTKSGINFLHPFSTLRLQGFVETGSLMETCFLIIFVVIIVIKLVPWI